MEIGLFIIASALVAFVSRASLRRVGSHGFYRFFAWESMLALLLLNIRYWHRDDGSALQTLAGILFTASLALVALGFAWLLLLGKPDSRRRDAELLRFERTTQLVTSGIYRYIRHPLYASLALLCLGFFCKDPSLIGGALAALSSGFLFAAARAEEAENIRYFGDAYRQYMKHSKMFIPFLL